MAVSIAMILYPDAAKNTPHMGASLLALVIGLWGAAVTSAALSVHFIDVAQGGGVLIAVATMGE